MRVAILGSGNIGTDLMMKILRGRRLELAAMIGIDPNSEGLARATRLGVAAVSDGVEGFLAGPASRDVRLVFDATSAKAHLAHAPLLRARGFRLVDLTPAAIGPAVVPVANLDEHLEADNLNLITCGGQATVPVVWAVRRTGCEVLYAEIVSAIASRSAGPGTRANIDEFTRTTGRGLELIGGARRGKAIIILNPAEPPILMRNTVYVLASPDADPSAVARSIAEIEGEVRGYVPGYRLVGEPIIEDRRADPVRMPGAPPSPGWKITCLLEVRGAGHYLPEYAGNLDIMTAAAARVGERIAERMEVGAA
jgi:acetaldehyde dehydrogenase